MYAVIECGGTQVLVSQNQKVRIPRIDAKEGEKYKIEKVLLVSNGQEVAVGTPLVKDAVVEATVVSHPRSGKIMGMKYKPKKDYRRRWGARELFTELMIDKLSHPTIKELSKPQAEKKAVKKAKPAKKAVKTEKKETKPAAADKGGKK
jgi:large subunit ribosomal protein L21